MQNGKQKPVQELRQDVILRYKALEQFTKEEARMQFLRMLRGFAYGTPLHTAGKEIQDSVIYLHYIFSVLLYGQESS